MDEPDFYGGGIDSAGFGGYGGRLGGDYCGPDYGEGEGEVYDEYEGAGYKGAAYGAVDYASGVADYASGVADYAGYGGAPDYDRGFDQGARYGAARYGEDIEEDYDEGY